MFKVISFLNMNTMEPDWVIIEAGCKIENSETHENKYQSFPPYFDSKGNICYNEKLDGFETMEDAYEAAHSIALLQNWFDDEKDAKIFAENIFIKS